MSVSPSKDDRKVKIIIADDHTFLREGLKKILEEENDISVIKQVSSGEQLLKLLKTETCDLIILDITLPDRSGLEVLQDVKKMYPKIPVLIMSMHPEDRYAVRAIKDGAAGYITKDAASEDLVNAVRRIIATGKYLSPGLAEKLFTNIQNKSQSNPHDSLSNREFQILCLMASGNSMSEIARTLSLSIKTVSTHRKHILDKMNLKTNAALTHYAIKNGLVD